MGFAIVFWGGGRFYRIRVRKGYNKILDKAAGLKSRSLTKNLGSGPYISARIGVSFSVKGLTKGGCPR